MLFSIYLYMVDMLEYFTRVYICIFHVRSCEWYVKMNVMKCHNFIKEF